MPLLPQNSHKVSFAFWAPSAQWALLSAVHALPHIHFISIYIIAHGVDQKPCVCGSAVHSMYQERGISAQCKSLTNAECLSRVHINLSWQIATSAFGNSHVYASENNCSSPSLTRVKLSWVYLIFYSQFALCFMFHGHFSFDSSSFSSSCLHTYAFPTHIQFLSPPPLNSYLSQLKKKKE